MKSTAWVLTVLLSLWFTGAMVAQTLVVYDRPPAPDALHPFLLLGTKQSATLGALVTERLSRIDLEENELRLNFVDRAEKVSEGVWDLIIKPDLKFSDGSALNAEDIAGSYARLVDMVSSEDAPMAARVLYRSLPLLERMEVADVNRVRCVFNKTVHNNELPGLLSMLPIIPSELTNKQLSEPGAAGSGPYTVEKVDEKVITLKANPYYHLGKPAIERVEYRIAGPEEVGKAMLEEGSLDMAVRPPQALIDRFRKQPTLVVRPVDTHRMLYLGFNFRSGSLFSRQPEMRQVVASLLDRAAMSEAAPLEGRAMLTGPFIPGSPYNDPEIIATPVSTTAATRKLSELGYRRIGETYRDSTNKALSFRLLASQSIDRVDLLTQVMAEVFERSGIGLTVEKIDDEGLRRLIHAPRGDFDLLLHEWTLDESEDVFELYHSSGLYNFLGYANRGVDERLQLERRAALFSSRVLYRREIHRLFMADAPAIFIWDSPDVAVFRADIANVPPLDPYFVIQGVHLWAAGEGGGA